MSTWIWPVTVAAVWFVVGIAVCFVFIGCQSIYCGSYGRVESVWAPLPSAQQVAETCQGIPPREPVLR